MNFTQYEIRDLLKAWIAISIAFAVLLVTPSLSFLVSLIVSALTVGTGFLLHELAHKKVALNYGCKAEFKSFDFMLLLAIAMSFFGFIIVAPGGVFIHKDGRAINKRQNGLISAAGPLTNLIFAVLFLPLMLIFKEGIIHQIGNYGYFINIWLALFNTLPFGPLDGAKIFHWNKKVGAAMLIAAIILLSLRGLFI